MLKVLIHNKGKGGSALQSAFGTNEDSLTASVFQLLTYLPDDMLWSIIRQTIKCEALPEKVGRLEHIGFWETWGVHGLPKHLKQKVGNNTYVEPDVLLVFEDFTMIVEAKRQDYGGQYEHQWRKEIILYYNQYQDNDYDSEQQPVLWALGGINELEAKDIHINGKDFLIVKSTWTMLLATIKSTLSSTDSPQVQRLLEDVTEAFDFHGFFVGTWLNEAGFEQQHIQSSSIDYFINNKKKKKYNSQQWLHTLPKITIQSQHLKTIEKWKTH